MQIMSVATLLLLATPNVYPTAQIEVDSEIRPPDMRLMDRMSSTLVDEMADELYPKPCLRMNFVIGNQLWNHQLYDTQEWLDLEDDALDDIEDALLNTGKLMLRETDLYRRTTEKIEDWFKVKIVAYLRQPKGRHTPKELTVDARLIGAELRQDDHRSIDAGIRFKLSDPSPFLEAELGPTHHDLMWRPVKECLEYSLFLPDDWGMRAKWSYERDWLEVGLLNIPAGRRLPPDTGGTLGLRHWFGDERWELVAEFYTLLPLHRH